MDSNRSSEVPQKDEKAKNLVRSKFKDVMVKAGEDIYRLDRIKLALFSDYFEKLFTDDSTEQNTDPIEVPIDSETFSAIVSVMYDDQLLSTSILNKNNYVSGVKAKLFLQMHNVDNEFAYFLASNYLAKALPSDLKKLVFDVFNFIVEMGNLKKSLRIVYHYLCKNLENFQDDEEFLSLPVDHFVGVIAFTVDQTEMYLVANRKTGFDEDLACLVCCKWICHDLENRLPHLVKVANAARTKLRRMKVNEQSVNVKIDLSDVNEQNKHELVRGYLDQLLHYRNIVDDGLADRLEEGNQNPRASLYVSHNAKNSHLIEKLQKYLAEGCFYDITVKVGEKVHKLHRCLLGSNMFGYFEELFSTEYAEAAAQCEGIPSLPDKDRVYTIEGVDPAIFDQLLAYIYGYTPVQISVNNLVGVFKAAYILKCREVLRNCKSKAKHFVDELEAKDATAMLDFTRGKAEYTDLYVRYLARHIRTWWPDASDLAEFYSVPWPNLERLLRSSHFYFDDPQQILDMCSKWIMHDAKNRYELISKVALAINRNGLSNLEDFKIETGSDLASISEKSIRDKLWDIISSMPFVPTSALSKAENRQLEDGPVFVSSTKYGLFEILNANLDQIAKFSFSHCDPRVDFRTPSAPIAKKTKSGDLNYEYDPEDIASFHKQMNESPCGISAATIDDNLFLLCYYYLESHLLVYNIPSNQFISLNTDSRIKPKSTLVNLHDELFCCLRNGSILKYSSPLNRWAIFSKPEPTGNQLLYTSDGKKLYRMYLAPGSANDPMPRNITQSYDFEQNTWISLPEFKKTPRYYHRFPDMYEVSAIGFAVINDGHPAILFKGKILWFDSESQNWNEIKLPQEQYVCDYPRFSFAIARGENKILEVFNNQLYHYSDSSKIWELKKEIPARKPSQSNFYDDELYRIVAVNRPIVRTT